MKQLNFKHANGNVYELESLYIKNITGDLSISITGKAENGDSIVAWGNLSEVLPEQPLLENIRTLLDTESSVFNGDVINKITLIISRVTGISTAAIKRLKDKTRRHEVVLARQICHWFSYLLSRDSLRVVGERVGGVDHATVSHSRKTINNLTDCNSERKLRGDILEIDGLLRDAGCVKENKTYEIAIENIKSKSK